MLHLPSRTTKPRTKGITSVQDTRLSTGELTAILTDYSDFIDVAKIGVGVAYILPNLQKKIDMYQEANTDVYFGGTLFEKFYHQNKLDDFLRYLDKHKINMLEVSCGTIDISIDDRCALVEKLSKNYRVLSEVGSKDQADIMPPSEWISEINALFQAGAEYVITEGRDSGTAGIYRPNGELRSGLVSDIIKETQVDKLIFEAPSSPVQMFFINSVGPNVNLGNVSPLDLALLEAQRQGLRSETFFLDK
ncbi:phosphosulfolactate synthase [Salibacteraceae bacterium]|jgi:phosphosulfolactate synthase|nr:phosphosulfolactate synthase [Flavobacteriales bacterium]MDB9701415.1 phosphosulfolactate synthase [Salibacteraceae bacterium]